VLDKRAAIVIVSGLLAHRQPAVLMPVPMRAADGAQTDATDRAQRSTQWRGSSSNSSSSSSRSTQWRGSSRNSSSSSSRSTQWRGSSSNSSSSSSRSTQWRGCGSARSLVGCVNGCSDGCASGGGDVCIASPTPTVHSLFHTPGVCTPCTPAAETTPSGVTGPSTLPPSQQSEGTAAGTALGADTMSERSLVQRRECSPRKAARARKAGAGAGRAALRGGRHTDFALQAEWTRSRPLQQETTSSFKSPDPQR
jgi:hypothetical protein